VIEQNIGQAVEAWVLHCGGIIDRSVEDERDDGLAGTTRMGDCGLP